MRGDGDALERADTQSAELISSALGRARASPSPSLDSKPIQKVVIPTPVTAHANLEIEEDLGAELTLQGAASRCPNLADLLAALADQDPLLGLGLGPNLAIDRGQAILPLADL